MNSLISMTRFFQMMHHRSLTASIVTVFVAFLAFGFVPDFEFRLQQGGAHFHFAASAMAFLSATVCLLTMIILLRDERSGYPSSRLQVAILLWALSCGPVLMLVGEII